MYDTSLDHLVCFIVFTGDSSPSILDECRSIEYIKNEGGVLMRGRRKLALLLSAKSS